jgi:hypothetical protein
MFLWHPSSAESDNGIRKTVGDPFRSVKATTFSFAVTSKRSMPIAESPSRVAPEAADARQHCSTEGASSSTEALIKSSSANQLECRMKSPSGEDR